MKRFMLSALFAVAGGAAFAQLVSTGPFAGAMSEDYEGFPNYFSGFPTDLTIMGGFATQDTMGFGVFAVYEPGAGASFGLGGRGSATVHGGAKANGQNYGPNAPFVTKFSAGVARFGGWFNYAEISGWDDTFEVFAYDTSGSLFDHVTVRLPYDNGMHWVGWTSATPIGSLIFEGDYIVMDDLQADLVPEPATMAALGLGVAALARRRRK